jgi:hypothetical protein
MATVHALDPKSKGTKLSAKLARDLADADANRSRQGQARRDRRSRAELYDKARPKLAAAKPRPQAASPSSAPPTATTPSASRTTSEAGHKVTATMRRFVNHQDGESWTIKRVGS